MNLFLLAFSATIAALLLPISTASAVGSPVETGPSGPSGPSGASSPASPVLRDPAGGQLIATCEAEGQPVRMIVDTGASHTTLDEAFARRALAQLPVSDVEITGTTNVKQAPKLMTGRFRADRIFVRKHPLFLIDLSGANGVLKTDIQGVLGMNTMRRMPFVFNVKESIYRCDPDLKISPCMKKLYGTVDEAGLLLVQAKAGGKTVPLLLDTGSSLTMIPESWWSAQGAETLRIDEANVNGRQQQQVKLGQPRDLEIGEGLVLKNVRPILTPDAANGLLGLDALRQIELYYLPDHKKNGSPAGAYYGRALEARRQP